MRAEPAETLCRALALLAGEEPEQEPSPARVQEWLHDALVLRGCGQRASSENLGRRKTRWKALLVRALHAAAAGYRRLRQPLRPIHTELVDQLECLEVERYASPETTPDPSSSVWLAEEIQRGEPGGLRSTLILGHGLSLALALGKLSQHRVFLAPWATPELPDPTELCRRLGIDVQQAAPLEPTEDLPEWLKRRFDTVVVVPPIGGFASQRALLAGIHALAPVEGRRLFWTGHQGRQLDYFGLFATLGRHGYVLQSLQSESAAFALDGDLAQQLVYDLLQTDEEGPLLDPEPLEALLSVRQEHEHLHEFRPAAEVVLRGHRLDLYPVLDADVVVYDGWLTPEYCLSLGFDADRQRPAREELVPAHWYPGDEWWIAKTKEGSPVGLSHLMLFDYWTKRALNFDVGIPVAAHRGQGLLDDLVRLTFRRVFEQLDSEALCANVSVSNVAICRGYRSNFFTPVRRYLDPELREELESIRIDSATYQSKVESGEISFPEATWKRTRR